jgi:hypothetical protein
MIENKIVECITNGQINNFYFTLSKKLLFIVTILCSVSLSSNFNLNMSQALLNFRVKNLFLLLKTFMF